MDVVPRESEKVTMFRDSAVGMLSTNDADANASEEGISNEREEADARTNTSVPKGDGPKQPNEITYEIRYVNAAQEHLHSRPLKRRAHDFEQDALTQSPVM